jgi:hypothetical protein
MRSTQRLVRTSSMSIPTIPCRSVKRSKGKDHLCQQTSMTTNPRDGFRAYPRGIGSTESSRHIDAPLGSTGRTESRAEDIIYGPVYRPQTHDGATGKPGKLLTGLPLSAFCRRQRIGILNKIAKIDPLLSGLKLERGKTRAGELNSSESLESKSDTMSSLPALLQVIPHE